METNDCSGEPGRLCMGLQKRSSGKKVRRRHCSLRKLRLRRKRESDYSMGCSSSEDSDCLPDPDVCKVNGHSESYRERPGSRSSGGGDQSSDCNPGVLKKPKPRHFRRTMRAQILKKHLNRFRHRTIQSRNLQKMKGLLSKGPDKSGCKTPPKKRRKTSGNGLVDDGGGTTLKKQSRSDSSSTVLFDSQDYFASEDCGSSEKETSRQQDSLIRIFASSLKQI